MGNNIRLSYNEYITLECLLGAKNIYGTFIDDYHERISSALIEKLWLDCQRTLTEKKYIQAEGDSININIALYYLLNECANSKRVFNVQISDHTGKLIDCTFHATSDAIYVCVENETANQELSMSIQSSNQIYRRICSYIGNANSPDILMDMPVVITEREYFLLMAGINMGDTEKIQFILPEDLNDNLKEDLLYALKDNRKSIAITAYSGDINDMYLFMLGKSLYWSISSTAQDTVEFQAYRYQDIRELLKNNLGINGRGVK